MIDDPKYHATVLPAGHYAVVDLHNNLVRKFNNQDDAIAYAKELNGPPQYRIFSVVSADGKDACVVRSSSKLSAFLIARGIGIEGTVSDLSRFYANPNREILPHLGTRTGVLGLEPYTKDDGKQSVRFTVK